ncbi:hypothetical protein DOTSEDRAFT_67460 [Dothistroma septosporum NZE10]|uniref:Uncharacterized protein n=1 Tax=Dothistroma septosporum (strain NZE10 / CBS 128990) TaxID=675120 RepID=N1PZH7_DOTSN|nr:hypothetical protein DOTSEDRAFT_67460 [Dothistroma septosporum NZE10]
MADIGARPLSPAASGKLSTPPSAYPMAQAITTAEAQTSLMVRLIEEKDRLINGKHDILSERNGLVTRLVREKGELVNSKDSLSQHHYEMLREKDDEILKLERRECHSEVALEWPDSGFASLH